MYFVVLLVSLVIIPRNFWEKDTKRSSCFFCAKKLKTAENIPGKTNIHSKTVWIFKLLFWRVIFGCFYNFTFVFYTFFKKFGLKKCHS